MREMPSHEKSDGVDDFEDLRYRISEVSTPRRHGARRMDQLGERLVGDLDETLAALRQLVATSDRTTF